MSALGQKQTYAAHKPMSAKGQKRTYPSARAMSASDVLVDSTHTCVDAQQACSEQVVRPRFEIPLGEHPQLLANPSNPRSS